LLLANFYYGPEGMGRQIQKLMSGREEKLRNFSDETFD